MVAVEPEAIELAAERARRDPKVRRDAVEAVTLAQPKGGEHEAGGRQGDVEPVVDAAGGGSHGRLRGSAVASISERCPGRSEPSGFGT